MKIGKAWILYEPDLLNRKSDDSVWNYDVWQGEYARIKIKFCMFAFE